MKNDTQNIWKNADWSFQARRLIQGLNRFPPNAKIIIFLRHSHRKNSEDVKELEKLGLTELGCEMAKIFGSSLPKYRPLRIFHSPSPRCKETAERIIEGFHETGGVSKLLGAISPLNDTKSSKGFITTQALKYQGIEFIRRWRDNHFSKKNIIDFFDYCINTYKNIVKNSEKTQKGGLEIHVSHDLFIIGLRYGWFDRLNKNIWVSFLGGFAVAFHNGYKYLLDIGKMSIEPIQLWDRKNIPLFILNHKKGGEKYGKE